MRQIRALQNISSLEDRIKVEEGLLRVEDCVFAHFIADGVSLSRACVSAYGYRSGSMIYRHKAEVMPLVMLLREQNKNYITDQLLMNREQRIEHLLETALIARHKYDHTSEAAHGAVYLKAMATINTMTGDIAPTEHLHTVTVTTKQLNAMTPHQLNEIYSRMMSGKVQLIDNTEEITENEPLTTQDGGATLQPGVE